MDMNKGRAVDITTDKESVRKELERSAEFGKRMIDEVYKDKIEELEMLKTFKPVDVANAERVVIVDIESPMQPIEQIEIRSWGRFSDTGLRFNKPLPPGEYRMIVTFVKLGQ